MQRPGVRLSVPLINRSTPARGWFAAERGVHGSSTSLLLPHGVGIPTTLVTPLLTSSTLCLQCFDAVGWVAGRASGL